MRNRVWTPLLPAVAALCLAASAGVAFADSGKPSSGNFDPTFGSRTDRPDGSSALTIGRRLPMAWDARVGTDVSLDPPPVSAASDNLLRGAAPDRSSGAIWGNLTMPGLPPLGFDKTSVDARLDAGKDEGKVGATLSRSLPIGSDLSVTLQNRYSVTQSLAGGAPATPSGIAVPPATPAPAWALDESVRPNVAPTGTTLSVGATTSMADTQWRSKLSVEQTLIGPLKLTTSVEDAGSATSKKSITAGFKRVW